MTTQGQMELPRWHVLRVVDVCYLAHTTETRKLPQRLSTRIKTKWVQYGELPFCLLPPNTNIKSFHNNTIIGY